MLKPESLHPSRSMFSQTVDVPRFSAVTCLGEALPCVLRGLSLCLSNIPPNCNDGFRRLLMYTFVRPRLLGQVHPTLICKKKSFFFQHPKALPPTGATGVSLRNTPSTVILTSVTSACQRGGGFHARVVGWDVHSRLQNKRWRSTHGARF